MVRIYRIMFWLMLALATQQTLSPEPMEVLQDRPDDFLHLLCWSTLSVALYLAYANRGRYTTLILVLFAYSISLEFAQILVPGRFFDTGDMLANAIACAAVFAVTKAWERLSPGFRPG